MKAYYNEIDPYCCAWLSNLMDAGHITPGRIDDRSIEEVCPDDLTRYTQCHWFAGIAGWSYALRLAGWPDDRPVWTGSCPCQPFSQAGKRGGVTDERHLWPAWFHLIEQCKPAVVFGEQVASKDGLSWLDLVCSDLEGAGYAVGAVDLCAAGISAPHIRQRLWFVADDEQQQWDGSGNAGQSRRIESTDGSDSSILADANPERCPEHPQLRQESLNHSQVAGSGKTVKLAYAFSHGAQRPGAKELKFDARCEAGELDNPVSNGRGEVGNDYGSNDRFLADAAISGSMGNSTSKQMGRAGLSRENFWGACDWLPCRDGKARPVEPGTKPLAHGIPARVGKLRAYGNAIIPQVAAEVIAAFMEEHSA